MILWKIHIIMNCSWDPVMLVFLRFWVLRNDGFSGALPGVFLAISLGRIGVRMPEVFLLKGGWGVYDPTPYVPPLSSLSHSLFSLHPLTLLDSNGDNIVSKAERCVPK